MTPPLPDHIEAHRDRMWRRDEDLRIESAIDAERFIEDVGFANTLTDARRAGPSLYIPVCGRRDVSLPRNVQKDEETRLTWYLKDEVMRRGRVYYAKLAGGRSMFVAPRLISHFAAVWMAGRTDEPEALSEASLREIARAYLAGAGMTLLGETARVTGLSRVEAGSGNHQLVDEGYAICVKRGVYALAASTESQIKNLKMHNANF